MIEFHRPSVDDKDWISHVLEYSDHRGCLYTFAQFDLWGEKYNTRICRIGDAVCGIAGTDDIYYLYPAGRYDITELVDILSGDAAERGIPLRFSAAEEWQVNELQEAFPGRFIAEECRNDFDYIYNASDLAELSGRKYHSKRNHIAKFIRKHPDWSYETISETNYSECIELANRWLLENPGSHDLEIENTIIRRALESMDFYGLEGGMIRINGIPVAFTIGEKLNDNIFVVHFEKSLKEYAECYSLINREFSSRIAEHFQLINREEDLGIEGLRRAKLSYYPVILLKKYLVTEVKP